MNNPFNDVVQAVYSIPRKSTLERHSWERSAMSCGCPLQERGTLRSEYRAFLSSQVEAEVPVCQR